MLVDFHRTFEIMVSYNSLSHQTSSSALKADQEQYSYWHGSQMSLYTRLINPPICGELKDDNGLVTSSVFSQIVSFAAENNLLHL